MNFVNIKSGSKGNASLLLMNESIILIDYGMNKKDLVNTLKELNKEIKDIDYIFLTHSHNDHIKGERFIDVSKIHTLKGIKNDLIDNSHYLEINNKYSFNDFEVEIIKTYHDSFYSIGFIFIDKITNERLAYITDTGYLDVLTLEKLKNLDYYVMESNHDIYYLLISNRTLTLKSRILSGIGHLSNDLSSLYLKDLIGRNTKSILLAHLSEECNSNELAISTLLNTLKSNNDYYINNDIDINKLDIRVLSQYEETWLK